MGYGTPKSLALMSILILGLTGICANEDEAGFTSTGLSHIPLGVAFAQSANMNSNSASNQDLGPIQEDNFTQLFPGDNGTGPIPEGDLVLPEDNFTESLMQDNMTNSTGENQS